MMMQFKIQPNIFMFVDDFVAEFVGFLYSL